MAPRIIKASSMARDAAKISQMRFEHWWCGKNIMKKRVERQNIIWDDCWMTLGPWRCYKQKVERTRRVEVEVGSCKVQVAGLVGGLPSFD